MDIRNQIQHPALAMLYGHWQVLARAGGIPRRRDFDPIDLPGEVWPRLFLISTGATVAECEIRVLGTYVVAAYGRDFRGRRCIDSEIPRFSDSNTARLLAEMIGDPAPRHHMGATKFRFSDDYLTCEQILLPLADEGGRLCATIGAIDFPSFRGVLM